MDISLHLWTVEKLKIFLTEKELPASGQNSKLVERVANFVEMEALETELGAAAFQNLSIAASLPFEALLISGWSIGELPRVTERQACWYLKHLGGFTKNDHTGVRLFQCGHVYDIAVAPLVSRMYTCTRCRPTMCKHLPFYKLFVSISRDETNDPFEEELSCTIEGANCYCEAGETQSCVHATAEVSPGLRSLPCAWSRPSAIGGKSTQSTNLDFGKASSEGYLPSSGCA